MDMELFKTLICVILINLPAAGSFTSDREEKMTEESESILTLFDFEDKKEIESWHAVNDNVMGGLSQGSATVNDEGCLVFSGAVSLENNGGFSSVRTLPANYRLKKYTGIKIRVKGDGRKYQFRIRTNSSFDGVAFKQEFTTAPDEWTEIELPFESFLPTFRGRILQDIPPLDPDEIKQIGFLISDKKEGKFELLVDRIAAYK